MLIIEKHSISHTQNRGSHFGDGREEKRKSFLSFKGELCEGVRAGTEDGWLHMNGHRRSAHRTREKKAEKEKKFNRSTKNRIKINKRRKKLLKVRWKSVMSELVSKSCDMQWRGHLDNCRLAKRHRTDTHLQVH